LAAKEVKMAVGEYLLQKGQPWQYKMMNYYF